MSLPIYQVDAFSSEIFKGNPAAVMPLSAWLDDAVLQAIAMENNLAETAFLVPADGAYELRWFTPRVEVPLCGHATLAAAHVLFEHLQEEGDTVRFLTHSGELRVSRDGAGLTLDFPSRNSAPVNVEYAVCQALGGTASEAKLPNEKPNQVMYVYEFESDIARLAPDFAALAKACEYGVIATAPGNSCDFVSRFFAPLMGIDEDPVTGSAHCILVPYWAARLGKNTLQARQISSRGGELQCELRDGRVFMTGRAVTFMSGQVEGVA